MAIERIQLRRGTEAQWTNTDPILGAAEIGIELGTPNKFKIGDGSSLWSELDYFITSSGAALDYIPLSDKAVANGVATLDANGAIPTGQLANLINSAPSTLDTLSELAAALADDADFATTITQSLSAKAESDHTHLKVDITDFAHTHIKTDITDFDHTHLKADITDFAHTHLMSDITDLDISVSYSELLGVPSTFNPSAHTHDASEIVTSLVTVSGTTHSLASSNANQIIRFTSSSAISFSITDVLSVGQSVVVIQDGTGQITFSGTGVAGAGTDAGVLKTRTRYSSATVLKIATNEYRVFGDLAIA